jgi:hypothetical protein
MKARYQIVFYLDAEIIQMQGYDDPQKQRDAFHAAVDCRDNHPWYDHVACYDLQTGRYIRSATYGDEIGKQRRQWNRLAVDQLIEQADKVAIKLHRAEDRDEGRMLNDLVAQLYKINAMLKTKDGEELDEHDQFWLACR